MTDEHTPLYQSEPKIQARTVKGRFANFRILAVIVLLGLFYGLPWLTWGDQPLVLFDLPARRFHLFGLTLVPQDLYLLTGLLILAAMTLFLFTALAGRLWCGYACPQTVWTEIFMWIENAVEGTRAQRLKLDNSPWNRRKIVRRGSKHVLWLVFALWTGFSFVGYFVPMTELWSSLWLGTLSSWTLFWVIFYSLATWGNAGFLREQVCRYMCPYARFQSVMFDPETLVIAYDNPRGEPRKLSARQKRAALALDAQADVSQGDCIDCTLCVQVCPTGIDIRQGLQYECIACAACVDVCDDVMDQVGKPRGLISYTSAAEQEGRKVQLLRPRTIAYAAVWLLVAGLMMTLLLVRSPLTLDVIRDRHAMVRVLTDGRVENIYTLKITNKTGDVRELVLSAEAPNGDTVTLSTRSLTVAPYQTMKEVVAVAAAPTEQATMALTFTVDWGDSHITSDARFIGRMP